MIDEQSNASPELIRTLHSHGLGSTNSSTSEVGQPAPCTMAYNFEQQHALEKGYTPRVAIVTGAVQGIGYAIARRLAESGIDIAVNDISGKSDHIDTVVSELRTLGRRAIGVPGDVSDEEDVKKIIRKTVEELGSVDIVYCYFLIY